jgi:hypothetical protein
MGEAQLLVEREGKLHGVRIMSVRRAGPYIELSFVAESAEWFAPDSEGADTDGWVRDVTDLTGNGALGCLPNEQMMGIWQETFERWRDEIDLVEIELDFVSQSISHYNPRTRELIRVEQGAGQDDPDWTNPPSEL